MQDKKLFILLLTIIITAIPAFAKYYCESDEIRGEYTPNSIRTVVKYLKKELTPKGKLTIKL